MARPVAEFPDVEVVVARWLRPLLAGVCDVGVALPDTWQASTAPLPFLQVMGDGAPTQVWPIMSSETVRPVVRAVSAPLAKAVAARAHAVLLAGPWPDEIGNVRTLTGVLATRDPISHAEIASFTVRVNTRATVVA